MRVSIGERGLNRADHMHCVYETEPRCADDLSFIFRESGKNSNAVAFYPRVFRNLRRWSFNENQ